MTYFNIDSKEVLKVDLDHPIAITIQTRCCTNWADILVYMPSDVVDIFPNYWDDIQGREISNSLDEINKIAALINFLYYKRFPDDLPLPAPYYTPTFTFDSDESELLHKLLLKAINTPF